MTPFSPENADELSYSKYYDLASVGFITLDASGVIVSTNAHAVTMLRTAADNLVSSYFVNFISFDEQELFQSYLQQLLDSKEKGTCTVHCLMDAMDDLIIQLNGVAVFDRNRHLRGFHLTLTDISRVCRLEEQLIQSQKLEALGVLASGIAHDFNNILGAILGFSELSLYELPPESRHRSHIDQIHKASIRGKELVKQILAYSRKVTQDQKPEFLQVVLNDAMKMVRATVPANVELVTYFDMECPMVMANTTQIHQILINIVTNALHSIHPNHGTIEISLKPLSANFRDEKVELSPDPSGFIRLQIKDTGHGMDKDTLEKIFNPFFTTKPPERGTGLGLSIVQNIVKNHYGTISVASTPGVGTVFNIYFPITELDIEDDAPEEESVALGKESILLVDDEQPLVMVGRKLLEHLGYSVTAVNESMRALQLFEENPKGYDLVITDQTMPNLTGVDLAIKITKTRQDIPIILLTGFRNAETVAKARAVGIREVLTKPIDIQVFSQKIRKVLDAI